MEDGRSLWSTIILAVETEWSLIRSFILAANISVFICICITVWVPTCAQTRISYRSISSQSSSIASNEAVLFILMIAALQQADGEKKMDGNLLQDTVPISSEKRSKFGLSRRGKISLLWKVLWQTPTYCNHIKWTVSKQSMKEYAVVM